MIMTFSRKPVWARIYLLVNIPAQFRTVRIARLDSSVEERLIWVREVTGSIPGDVTPAVYKDGTSNLPCQALSNGRTGGGLSGWPRG